MAKINKKKLLENLKSIESSVTTSTRSKKQSAMGEVVLIEIPRSKEEVLANTLLASPGKVVKKPKSPKVVVEKPQRCFIYKGTLKGTDIQITQVRFKAFDLLSVCTAWCEEHCESYEIKDDKSGKLLVKK